MWSVFIVKFLISVRSLDGFSPIFFFPAALRYPGEGGGELSVLHGAKALGTSPQFSKLSCFNPFCPSLWVFSSGAPQQFPLSLSSLRISAASFSCFQHCCTSSGMLKVHGVDDHSHEHHKSHQILSKDAELSMFWLEKWGTASGLTELVASVVFQKVWIFQFGLLH